MKGPPGARANSTIYYLVSCQDENAVSKTLAMSRKDKNDHLDHPSVKTRSLQVRDPIRIHCFLMQWKTMNGIVSEVQIEDRQNQHEPVDVCACCDD